MGPTIKKICEQECISVGCVPPAALAVPRGSPPGTSLDQAPHPPGAGPPEPGTPRTRHPLDQAPPQEQVPPGPGTPDQAPPPRGQNHRRL